MIRRYDFLKAIAGDTRNALVVAAGGAAREWQALKSGDGCFRPRTLGLASSIALGISIGLPQRKVMVIDGDGAFLMNLCGLPTIASQNPGNLIHLLFDNEIYEASGGTATASSVADAVALARAAGYKYASWVGTPEEFRAEFVSARRRGELTLIATKVDPGRPKNLPPLRLDELENKYRFMRYLEETEKTGILSPGFDSKL